MNRPDPADARIVRAAPNLGDLRSNVTVSPNVFLRSADDQRPQDDVAFRCRVRGPAAIREIVPDGIISSVTNRFQIPEIGDGEREAALGGRLPAVPFALLPEQVRELKAFRCIECGRSTVSVWCDGGGRVQQAFCTCMCQRRHGERERDD